MRIRGFAPGLLLALLGSAAPAEQMARFRSDDRRFSLELPAGWTVTPEGAKGNDVLRLSAAAPGVEGEVLAVICLLQGQRDSLLQAFVEREERKARPGTLSAEVVTSPVPHLLRGFRREDGTERVEAIAYSMVRRNGIALDFECPAASWPALRDTFLKIARSVEANVVEWPAHPADFRRETKDGFVYLVHPAVKSVHVKALQSLIRRVAGMFEDLHGKIPTPDESPPLVVMLNSLDDGKELFDMKSAANGFEVDTLGGRLFATPLPAADDGRGRATCVMKAFQLMLVQRYGSSRPYWMYSAEARLVWSEEISGKKLPVVDGYLFKDLARPQVPFAEIVEREAKSSFDDAFRANAAAYVLFFREGPAKYQRAYQAFKADAAASRDIALAVDTHLLSFDPATMKVDLERWLKRSVKNADGK